MCLMVSVRHVGAHPGGHQHGVSIQISINLSKTFLRISRIRNILLAWILARVFVYLPPFISQIPDFIYWTVLIFILIYFEWRDTENQQYSLIWPIQGCAAGQGMVFVVSVLDRVYNSARVCPRHGIQFRGSLSTVHMICASLFYYKQGVRPL